MNTYSEDSVLNNRRIKTKIIRRRYLDEKLTIIQKILKSKISYNSERMCIRQLNTTVPGG